VIWAAPADADPSSPESWRAANPLIGVTIRESAVKDEWDRAKGSPALEARFRLLYLGQQVTAAEKWIDQELWGKCCKPFTSEDVAESALFVGIDASKVDDLTAAVFSYVQPDKVFVDSRFWVPKKTADRYEEKDGIPYTAWAEAGDIELLEDSTISLEVQKRIADQIIELHKVHPITMCCYDRAYSENLIAHISAAGIPTMAIGQGWGVSSGCSALDRRLKEKSIQIMPNAVMDFCAQNVEVKHDERGNYWPTKPQSNRGNAQRKSQKVDGISGLVTALTEAGKHDRLAAASYVSAELLDL
jgi:phage terminase large subunit-like protein